MPMDESDDFIGALRATNDGPEGSAPIVTAPPPPPTDLIDLGSDTATRPTPEMRRFMAEAPVGDDMLAEDPTVNLLEGMVAELLGKEAAVFLTSGTQCNLIAMLLGARHGDRYQGQPRRGRGLGECPRNRQRGHAQRGHGIGLRRGHRLSGRRAVHRYRLGAGVGARAGVGAGPHARVGALEGIEDLAAFGGELAADVGGGAASGEREGEREGGGRPQHPDADYRLRAASGAAPIDRWGWDDGATKRPGSGLDVYSRA